MEERGGSATLDLPSVAEVLGTGRLRLSLTYGRVIAYVFSRAA